MPAGYRDTTFNTVITVSAATKVRSGDIQTDIPAVFSTNVGTKLAQAWADTNQSTTIINPPPEKVRPGIFISPMETVQVSRKSAQAVAPYIVARTTKNPQRFID